MNGILCEILIKIISTNMYDFLILTNLKIMYFFQ